MSSKRKHPEGADSLSKSKKACTETSFVELSLLEELPLEILEVICSFISCSSILTMMLTSKTINSNIANSYAIMDRFKITFEHINELINNNMDSINQRKYSNIIIPYIKQKDLYESLIQLIKYGELIKEITFVGSYSTKVVSNILQVCENVRKININYHRSTDAQNRIDKKVLNFDTLAYATDKQIEASNLAIEKELTYDPLPINLPRLKSLECPSSSMFGLFMNCQLKEISIGGVTLLKAWRLKRFLDKQNSLKIMRIYTTAIFNGDFLSKANFKLKVFDFGFSYFSDNLNMKNFLTFVDQHKESMEKLSVPLSLLQHFGEFKLIKALSLKVCRNNYHLNSIPMPQVKVLSIIINIQDRGRGLNINKIEEIFPNTKELRIKYERNSPQYSNLPSIGKMTKIANLTLELSLHIDLTCFSSFNLENLQLINCKFPQGLKLPKTKNLIIDNTCFPAGSKPFSQTHLQKMTVKKCSDLNWILEIVTTDVIVEHLTLEKLKLAKTIHQAIISNPQKVHQLLLENVEIDENA